MAGYSETPLAKKLGVRAGQKIWLVDPPEGFALPGDVELLQKKPRSPVAMTIGFVTEAARLAKALPAWKAATDPYGAIWVAWPKKAAQKTVPSDVSEGLVRDLALELGLVDNKVCAIDEVWSGLRVVVRLADRPAR